MDILNITNMNKKYVEIAKKKLKSHKIKGEKSSLSIFQVAELIDVITGKKENFTIDNAVLFGQIGAN
ncbi:MAG TPA: hypothetical protein EYG85_10170 [Crocinitomix sp.]|nr:hypothetical protein [Crocinitomix sp.]